MQSNHWRTISPWCVNLMNHLAYKPNNHISNHNKIHLRNLFRRKFGKHSVRSISKLAHKAHQIPLASASDFPPLSRDQLKSRCTQRGFQKPTKTFRPSPTPAATIPALTSTNRFQALLQEEVSEVLQLDPHKINTTPPQPHSVQTLQTNPPPQTPTSTPKRKPTSPPTTSPTK